MNKKSIQGSFRDPSGFVFSCDGAIYRQVNTSYKEQYDHFMGSGLYESLVNSQLLISHKEVGLEYAQTDVAYKVLKPQLVPFVSYPYEWCYSQLKDAALVTLKIQKKAIDFGMTLKDGSAYNIQFINCRPMFIDTLSFQKYKDGDLWVAYRQFCQHFLAPLALMNYTDIRLNQLFRTNIDGCPLDLAGALLPFRTCLRIPLFLHVHLHSRSQKHFADQRVKVGRRKISRLGFMGLIDSLESAIRKMTWHISSTEWGDYYSNMSYSDCAVEHKCQLVGEFMEQLNPRMVWDIGANTGRYSRIASRRRIPVIAFDIDPACVEKNYLHCKKEKESHILPLLSDISNPSPGIGWNNEERMSLVSRGPTDTVLALALVHHLAISNNVPFSLIARFLSNICSSLIIEFVPKDDSQVQRLLATREDVFPDYTQQAFEYAFMERFAIEKTMRIKETQRTLYLMIRKEGPS